MADEGAWGDPALLDDEPLYDLAALELGQAPLQGETLARLTEWVQAVDRGEERPPLPDPYQSASERAAALRPQSGAPALTLVRPAEPDAPSPLELPLPGLDTPPPARPAAPAPPATPWEPPDLSGLTAKEAQARTERGLANVDHRRERGNLEVIRENVFTFFNSVLFSLIGILIVLGIVDSEADHFQDAFFVGVVVSANVAVGTFQEIRAMGKLRELVALTAPHATVIRERKEISILARDVVQGDLLHLRAGDQVVADGPVVWESADIDESLLTGESSSVRRGPGDELRSGAFCTGGGVYYRAQRVGADAYAMQLASEARQLVRRETPLQIRFRRILRVLLVATAFLGGLLVVSFLVRNRELADAIKATTATISSVVPEGLLLGFTVAFAAGAVRVSRIGAIVQDITSVEALNYVDAICLDKTGTITANRLSLQRQHWAEGAESLRPWLGAFAAATADESRTATALAAGLTAFSNGAAPEEVVPFNSERRWSAATLRLGSERRNFVLGAPETVLLHCDNAAPFQERYRDATRAGLRGVIFAEVAYLPDPEAGLGPVRALALLTVADELRPEVKRAFETMARLQIQPKIISGDNPGTVAALIRQLGIELPGGVISGAELGRLEGEAFDQAVEDHSIFGRIDPAQKASIVAALKRNGHYVAMVGDGANDVRALREADVGVAMESGTSTARAVAGIILRNDSFEALVEGSRVAQTVLGNAAQMSKLFITKSFYAFLIIIASNMLGLDFPFLPRHGSLTALFTLGIPAIFITLTTPPPEAGRDFVNNTLRFALPAALALAVSAAAVHLLTEGILGRPIEDSRTLVSTTIGIVGLAYMVEVIGFEGASRERLMRPALVTFFGVALLGLFILILYTPGFRDFFDFHPIRAEEWGIIIFAVTASLTGQFLISRYWREIFSWVTGRHDELEAARGRAV